MDESDDPSMVHIILYYVNVNLTLYNNIKAFSRF